MITDDLGPDRAISILAGTVGSRAYGLARPDSDHDSLGVFAWPTRDLLGLTTPPEDIGHTGPGGDDWRHYEARKFLRLILAGNPHVTELLWLPEYTTINPWGHALVNIRHRLSAAPLIRRCYLGYATQQFKRLRDRGDGTFSSDTAKRTAKHARHLHRLLIQGYEFYRTGTLTVRLTPDLALTVGEFGEAVADGDTSPAERLLTSYERRFDSTPPALPDKPDTDLAEAWLLAVREDYRS